MRAFEGGEGRRGPYAFVAEQEEDADRLGLADDQNEVDLEHSELRHLKRGAFAEDDVDVIGLGLAFEAGGQIGVVAEHGVIEALVRAEIADDAFAGVEADAGAHFPERPAGRGRLGAPGIVESRQLGAHRQGRETGVLGVPRILEGGVPERHDAVGHVFIDRAVMRHDDVGHRRQIAVEKTRQLAGVEPFGDRRKPADVAEHDRQLAQLAA